MTFREEHIARFRRSIWYVLWLRLAVQSLAVGLWICGAGIVVVRVAWEVPVALAALVLLPLPLVALGCAWFAWRRTPDAMVLRAAIDRASQADGLLMADGEVPLGNWSGELSSRPLQLPRISWRASRSLGAMLLAVVFSALALALPTQWLSTTTSPRKQLDVAQYVDSLEDKMDTLEVLEVVEEEDAASLRAELDKVRANADGEDPAKTLESLDHVKTQLENLATDEALAELEASREMSSLASAAEALEQASDEMSSEGLDQAMQDLAEMIEQAAKDCEGASSDSLEDADSLCEGGLSLDELGDLADALAGGCDASREMLEKLTDADLIDADILQGALRQLTPEQIRELVARLKECDGDCEGFCEGDLAILLEGCEICLAKGCEGDDGASLALLLSGVGRGGITRGPGAAQLNFAGETSEHGATFKSEMVAPGGIDLDNEFVSKIEGRAKPGNKERREASTGGGLESASGSSGAHTRHVLPNHRKTVEGYFNRDSAKTRETP